MGNDKLKQIKNSLEIDIDFILNGRHVTRKISNKVMSIILPKVTIFSHRTLERRHNLSGLSAHIVRKSIRNELSNHLKSYLTKASKKNYKLKLNMNGGKNE